MPPLPPKRSRLAGLEVENCKLINGRNHEDVWIATAGREDVSFSAQVYYSMAEERCLEWGLTS